MKQGLIFLMPLTLAIGCSNDESSSEPKAVTAEDSVRAIMDGVRDGKPVVAWQALPPSYQTDVNELVRSFAGSMDPNLWKQITDSVGTVHQLLVDKNEFIVNHPGIAEADDPETAKKSISQISGLLKSILDSTGDLEKLKTFDGEQFMTTTGSDLFAQLDTLAKLAPQTGKTTASGLAALDGVRIETIESTDSTATLKITQPDGKTETQLFTKVEGKWIPQEMADTWKQQIAEAKTAIAELPQKIPQMQMGMMMVTGMIQGTLAPLQAAETQEDFNAAVAGVQQQAMGLFMGGGGGLGGPPSGFGGPPSGFGGPFGTEDPGDNPPSSLNDPGKSLNDPNQPAPEDKPAE